MRTFVRRIGSPELWLGLGIGLFILALGSISILAPRPLPIWVASVFWLVAVTTLVGWDWRLRVLLGFGLALTLTIAWVWLARNELTPPESSTRYAMFFGIVFLTVIVASIFIEQAKRLWESTQAELHRQIGLLQELTIIDEETGLHRLAKGLDVLRREVQRLRRNNLPLTVVRIRVNALPPRKAWLGACQTIVGSLRAIDIVLGVDDREIGLILPETNINGAEIVIQRVERQLTEALGIECRAGVASFPEDSVTAEGLWQEAAYALDLAVESQIPVVSRHLMSTDRSEAH